MRTRLFIIVFAFLALMLLTPEARAQRVSQLPKADTAPAQTEEPEKLLLGEGIAAVVNDSVISTSDLRARMGLALLTSGLPDTLDVKKRLFPQVLRGLIDETLQMQEGKRLNVTVADEEISAALQKVAEDNHIPGGDMLAFLKGHGISPSTMENQIRSVLTWNKVVARELRPRVDVGDDEINAVVERLRANAGKQEFLVSEIFLTLDNPKEEEDVKAFAQNLTEQIRSGTPFGSVARQFSQGTGATSGGDIGWIQAGQLAPELDKALQNLQSGEVVGPIRTSDGFHILGVREKRTIALGDPKEMTVSLQQAFRPFTADQDRESLLLEADRLRQAFDSCEGLQGKLKTMYPFWRWQDLGMTKLATAPSWLIEKVRDIPEGRASDAMATDKGALILFVCKRDMPETVDRSAIMNMIGTERLELLARRLLRDLRRNAYLDVKIGQK